MFIQNGKNGCYARQNTVQQPHEIQLTDTNLEHYAMEVLQKSSYITQSLLQNFYVSLPNPKRSFN